MIVVEHDEETIRRAEHVVDLGPGGGVNGGHVVAQGTVAALMRSKASLTGQLLKNPLRHSLVRARPRTRQEQSRIRGARLHNLKGFDACPCPWRA